MASVGGQWACLHACARACGRRGSFSSSASVGFIAFLFPTCKSPSQSWRGSLWQQHRCAVIFAESAPPLVICVRGFWRPHSIGFSDNRFVLATQVYHVSVACLLSWLLPHAIDCRRCRPGGIAFARCTWRRLVASHEVASWPHRLGVARRSIMQAPSSRVRPIAFLPFTISPVFPLHGVCRHSQASAYQMEAGLGRQGASRVRWMLSLRPPNTHPHSQSCCCSCSFAFACLTDLCCFPLLPGHI